MHEMMKQQQSLLVSVSGMTGDGSITSCQECLTTAELQSRDPKNEFGSDIFWGGQVNKMTFPVPFPCHPGI